jgi:6-phosphogluconate dehydrogenase
VAYKVGVVGLGVMGANLALNMERNGFDVVGYDSDQAKAQTILRHGRRKMPSRRRLVPATTCSNRSIESGRPLLPILNRIAKLRACLKAVKSKTAHN